MEDLFRLGICLGIIRLLYGFFRVLYFYNFSIKKWNQTEGIVLRSGAIYSEDSSDSDMHGWKYQLKYSYVVNNVEYISTNFSENIEFIKPYEDMVEVVEGYTTGDTIIVYFNPKKPEKAVVNNKYSYYNLILLLFAIVVIVITYDIWE